jgi:carboxymethylenebutenolidase
MAGSNILIESGGGESFSAYLATPEGGAGAGALVLQEIFGVNAVMRAVCDGYAAKGYLALCPDLFWRQEPDIQITDQSEAEWAHAFALYRGFDEARGVEDAITALSALRAQPGCSGKVGATGYCLGGKLAYLMATRSSVDCSVGYYGIGIEATLNEAGDIPKPLMLHLAEKDQFVPPESQGQIMDNLGANPLVTIHSYPDRDHAFARVGGEHYDAADAGLANSRTAAFFEEHLT